MKILQNKTALLVIDVQNDFISGASPYSAQMLDRALISRIKKLIDKARRSKLSIIFTQHTINQDKSNAEKDEPKDVRACIKGTRGWEIIKELRPRRGEIVVQKDKYDAFQDTNLNTILKNLKIEKLIICGVLTNNCVRATTEGAHSRGYRIAIVGDCCGATSYISDFTLEQIHDITLRDLAERIYKLELVELKEIN